MSVAMDALHEEVKKRYPRSRTVTVRVSGTLFSKCTFLGLLISTGTSISICMSPLKVKKLQNTAEMITKNKYSRIDLVRGDSLNFSRMVSSSFIFQIVRIGQQ